MMGELNAEFKSCDEIAAEAHWMDTAAGLSIEWKWR